MTLRIFTSLPPGMNRFDKAGENIGREHFRACLKSWHDHGLDIISINSKHESRGETEAEFPVTRIAIERDAKDICGKPLIYFSDFIKTIHANASGPVVITNADIELDLTNADLKRIAKLERGTFICERRLDYEYEKSDHLQPYIGGFDFFVIHADDLLLLADSGLVFGMPWWDHFIPVILLAHNLSQIRLEDASHIYHREHHERWDMNKFFQFGYVYRDELKKLSEAQNLSTGFRTMYARLQHIEIDLPHFPFRRRHNFFRNLFRVKPKDPVHNHMLWIAFCNLRLIEIPHDTPMRRLSVTRFMQRLPL